MSTQTPLSYLGNRLGMELTRMGQTTSSQQKIPVTGAIQSAEPAQAAEAPPYVRLELMGAPNTIAYLDTKTGEILRAKIGPRAEFYISEYYDPA